MARQLFQQPKSLFSVPLFLAPAFMTIAPSILTARSFSCTSSTQNQIPRGNRDKSKNRGVSAIRRTGPRQRLSVVKLGALPKPVSDPTEARAAFEVNPNHGLWGFFNESKEAIVPPSEEGSHGRAWSKKELARKGWDDLHKLYWVCIKESNMVRTRNNERKRLRAGYGDVENQGRLRALFKTMDRIRSVLLERHYARFDANLLLGEKFLFEIYPDLLQEQIPLRDLGLEPGLNETLTSTDETSISDAVGATDAPRPNDIPNFRTSNQTQKSVE